MKRYSLAFLIFFSLSSRGEVETPELYSHVCSYGLVSTGSNFPMPIYIYFSENESMQTQIYIEKEGSYGESSENWRKISYIYFAPGKSPREALMKYSRLISEETGVSDFHLHEAGRGLFCEENYQYLGKEQPF